MALRNFLFLTFGLLVGFWIGRVTSVSDVPARSGDLAVARPYVDRVAPPASTPPAPRIEPAAGETKRHEEPSPSAEASPKRIRREKLEAIRDERDVESFLKDVGRANLFDVLRNATPYDRIDEALSQINGRFSGTVRLTDPPGKHWEMQMEAALQIRRRKLAGMTRIILSENGKVISHLDGSGDQVDGYRRIGDGQGILVKASPTRYFQLYYLPTVDAFVGNYYDQVAPDRILYKGTVRLDRG